jgi:pimeloyl-ACP methyl ester carboxylesterase
MEEMKLDPNTHVSRRQSIKFGATGMAISLLPASALSAAEAKSSAPKEDAMTDNTAIRPFHVSFPETDLTDLNRRIKLTRWPERELVSDITQGVKLDTMQTLAKYWASDYDWRRCEAQLNALPNFVTEIDGLDIHFIHVRSKHENALPIIVTHGWPGSVIEQLKIIDPLVNPTAHGGKASDAFDLVIPSMPGYGFSAKPTAPGWGPERIARANATLMTRLGYSKYVAQGGDWGALITQLMAKQQPAGLLAIHTNMPGAVPIEINRAALAGAPMPVGLSAEEQHAYDRLVFFYGKGLAYAQEMANRPQTLYGVSDSPIGLASWILDHDAESFLMIARSFAGQPEGLSKDDVLDNITLYWLTNTGVSSARLYWENKLAFFEPMGITIPVAVSCFPTELYPCPKSWAEKAFPNLIHYNKLPKGGHFAAWEQPEFFVAEMRESFRPLRKSV